MEEKEPPYPDDLKKYTRYFANNWWRALLALGLALPITGVLVACFMFAVGYYQGPTSDLHNATIGEAILGIILFALLMMIKGGEGYRLLIIAIACVLFFTFSGGWRWVGNKLAEKLGRD